MSLRIPGAALLSFLLLSLPASVRAGQDGEGEIDEEIEGFEDLADDDFTQHVSLAPGSLLGSLSGNYEYLVARRHGLLAEAAYAVFGAGAGSWSTGVAYRFHFHGGMGGPFAGPFLRFGEFETELPLEKGKFEVSGSALVAGANAGYRWQGTRGVAFTLRGGYGHPVVKEVAWSPSEPKEAGFFEGMLGLDVELNVGYSF
jgi:hypothetical protein